MSEPSLSDIGPEPKANFGPAEPPEQLLLRESERMTQLLHARRKATMAIAIVFALATLSAVFLLTQYVRSEQTRIDLLSSQLTSAKERLRTQEEWLDRLDRDRALVDSILMQYSILIARVQDSTESYSQALVTGVDSALRMEMSRTERRMGQQSARWDSAWSRGGRRISDSIGARLILAEGAVSDFTRKLDTLPASVARHEQGIIEIGVFNDSVRGVLSSLDEDVRILQRSTRRDSTILRTIQRNITELDTAMATTRGRLEDLERPQVVAPNPAGAPSPVRR